MERPLPAYAGSEPYVFVSYAHEDAQAVYLEIRRWQESGTHVWYDEGISPGSEWSEALAQAIRGCDSFVYFVTPRSIASENCRRELIFAQEEKRHVVAVFLEETEISPGVRLSLGNRQMIAKHALSAAEYQRKLAGVLGGAQTVTRELPIDARPSRWWSPMAAVAGVAFTLAILLYLYGRDVAEPDTPAATVRLSISLPRGQPLRIASEFGYPLALAPDGRQVAYVSEVDAVAQLVVRQLDSFAARVLPGTEGARQPFFSPDGRWIGFFARGQLLRVPTAGGSPIVVASYEGEPLGGSWSRRDEILYGSVPGVLRHVSITGEDRAPKLFDEVRAAYPSFLPDGEHALVRDVEGLLLISVLTGQTQRLLTYTGAQARYLNSGHLLFAEQGERLRVVPFDIASMRISGPAVPVLDDVFRAPGSGAALFDVSDNGSLVYVRGGFQRSLRFVDRNGRAQDIVPESRGYRFPRFDPAGTRVAVTVDPRPSQLWVYELARASSVRLTHAGHNILPVWSPDAASIVYWRDRGIHRLELDRVGRSVPVELSGGSGIGTASYPYSVSPDGTVVALESGSDETGWNIVLMSSVTGTLETYLETPANERTPQIAPNGRWLAYTSDETGGDEVYVRSYPTAGSAVRVSDNGGIDPLWSRDGSELYYREGNKAKAVSVSYEPDIAVTPPVMLFTAPFDGTQSQNWDVDPSGRFVYVESDPATTREFQVVLNWFSELAGS